MRIGKKEYQATQGNIEEITRLQDTAIEMVKKYLAKPIKEIEDLGCYSRQELATAYLMLAFHALRHGSTKDKAEDRFNVLSHFSKQRIELHMEEQQQKKSLFH